MQLVRRMALPLLVGASLVFGFASSGLSQDTAPAAEWNQERVAAIADELASEASRLRQVVRKAFGGSQIGGGSARSRFRLRDLLRLLENETRHLRRQLEDGKGREETMPVYRRVMSTVSDARENARRTFLSEDVLAQADKARDALMRLTAYYDPSANANPNVEADAEKAQGQ